MIKSRQILGRAGPGELLPLPLGWSAAGRQLQLRPVVAAAVDPALSPPSPGAQQVGGTEGEQQIQPPAAAAVHDWSQGSSDGRHTIKLDGLDECQTRLVCCPSLGITGAMASSVLLVPAIGQGMRAQLLGWAGVLQGVLAVDAAMPHGACLPACSAGLRRQ